MLLMTLRSAPHARSAAGPGSRDLHRSHLAATPAAQVGRARPVCYPAKHASQPLQSRPPAVTECRRSGQPVGQSPGSVERSCQWGSRSHGSRAQEAHEAAQRAVPLDAEQAGRHLRPQALARASQAARVPAPDPDPAEQAQVRPQRQGGHRHPDAALRQGGRQGADGRHLPSRADGRDRHRQHRRALPAGVRRQGALRHAPHQQGRGLLQAVQGQAAAVWQGRRAVHRHARRADHPLPRPRHQGERHDRVRHRLGQGHRAHQVRPGPGVHGGGRQEQGARWHSHLPREAQGLLRHRHRARRGRQRVCDAVAECVCHRQGVQPAHLPAQGQGRAPDDHAGAGQDVRHQHRLTAWSQCVGWPCGGCAAAWLPVSC